MKRKNRLFATIQIVLMMLLASTMVAGAQQKSPVSDSPYTPSQYRQGVSKPAGGGGILLAPVSSGFTYQGRLTNGGAVANGQYDLIFNLWDASSGGTQVGSQVTMNSQSVSDGLFTVTLDFGAGAFQGQVRWLEIQVRPAGIGAYTTLSPRQQLSAAPYAMSLMPGAVVTGTLAAPMLSLTNTGNGPAVLGNSTLGIGVYGISSNGSGVEGQSTDGHGVYGVTSNVTKAGVFGIHTGGGSAIMGETNSNTEAAIYGVNTGSGPSIFGEGTSNTGVSGYSASSVGVYGESNTGEGVHGTSYNGYTGVYGEGNDVGGHGVVGLAPDGTGVSGISTTGSAVYGTSSSGQGVFGLSTSNYGVHGSSSTDSGVRGNTNTGSSSVAGVYGETTANGGNGVIGEANNGSTSNGVWGKSTSGYGVHGGSTSGYGVYGESISGYGVYGTTSGGASVAAVRGIATSSNSNGVIGEANSGTSAYGVWGKSTSGYAGFFSGNVQVNGTLSKSAGSFKIDDPIDPANKYLSHSFVESPDMMNIYNGEVTMDSKGEVTVTMPAWFQALNQDFRYQLTAVGAPGPNLYIAQKIAGNHFKIAGGTSGMEVSWQVTGIRHDPYAEAHRIPVEEQKPSNEKGYYLQPELYGQSPTKAIENARGGAQTTPTGASTNK